jgi:hypothetical protein
MLWQMGDIYTCILHVQCSQFAWFVARLTSHFNGAYANNSYVTVSFYSVQFQQVSFRGVRALLLDAPNNQTVSLLPYTSDHSKEPPLNICIWVLLHIWKSERCSWSSPSPHQVTKKCRHLGEDRCLRLPSRSITHRHVNSPCMQWLHFWPHAAYWRIWNSSAVSIVAFVW